MIRTQRLTLRRLIDSDAGTVFQYRSDPEVQRYQSWTPRDVEAIREFIRNQKKDAPVGSGEWFQLGIVLNETGELIGDLGIRFVRDENQQAEIGITLSPPHQKSGYAQEAVKGALDHLFSALKMHRVFASIDPRNQPSIQLVERVGMRKEAHFIKSLRFKSQWADDLIYALLDEEWIAHKNL